MLNHISSLTEAKRCLLITSKTTGTPGIRGIKAEIFEALVSMRYTVPEVAMGINSDVSYEKVANEIERFHKFDVAFIDPFHTYEYSLKTLDLGVIMVKDSAWIVVHDCFPPYELTQENYVEGPWCGSTYQAFIDFASQTDRAWFVINADFGIGILAPRKTSNLLKGGDLYARFKWALLGDKRKRERLLSRDAPKIFRLIDEKGFYDVFSKLFHNQLVILSNFQEIN